MRDLNRFLMFYNSIQSANLTVRYINFINFAQTVDDFNEYWVGENTGAPLISFQRRSKKLQKKINMYAIYISNASVKETYRTI